MTTPAGYRRIRQTYGTVGTDWLSPSSATFPGALSFAQVQYPQPTTFRGDGTPAGAFGAPQLTWEFAPLTQTQFYQVQSLFAHVPAEWNYAPVEVEDIDPRETTANAKYHVWTGIALRPDRPETWRNTGAGHMVFGVRLLVTALEDVTE
jgi:hypothetical protein